MNLLKPIKCSCCGETNEAYYEFFGHQIKQKCLNCKTYIKFIKNDEVPDFKDSYLRILSLSNQQNDLLNRVNATAKVSENLSRIERNMMFWQLYLDVLKRREVHHESC